MRLGDYVRYASHAMAIESKYKESVENKYIQATLVPSAAMILQHQKKCFQQARGISNDSIVLRDKRIIELNNDLIQLYSDSGFNEIVNRNISEIEAYIQALNSKTAEKNISNLNEIRGKEQDLNVLILKTKQFFNIIATYENMQQVSFAFEPIYKKLNALQNYVCAQLGPEISPPPEKSFLKRLIWTEYIIKGEYLEQAGKQFFKEHLPRDYRIIQTGRIGGQIDIFGNFQSSRSMKEDIMILDDQNFQIEFTIGDQKKQMGIDEFIQYVESYKGSKKIQLTIEGYQTLQQHLISGVQAKATKTNRIKFGNINLKDVYKNSIQGISLWYLKQIYAKENHKGGLPLRATHSDYNLLFNYNLAKNLNYIIGKNNNLLLTRKGLQDMNTFIMEQFNNGRYFYGIEDAHLNSTAGIPITVDFI